MAEVYIVATPPANAVEVENSPYISSRLGCVSMRLLRVAGLVLGFVSALTSSAVAAPITYQYTGVGSGTIGGLSFTNQPFVIHATGDTSNRMGSSSTFFSIINTTADITIGALGNFTFLTPTEFFNNPSSQLGFAAASSLTLYGFQVNNAQFQAWDMLSSIGPISGTAFLGQWTISPINTSGGVLVFNPGSSAATFQATVGTTIISVSGPAANNAPGIFSTAVVAFSFTVGQFYSNVTISADLIGNFTGTVYLTNKIGPGTTAAANQIAAATFTSSNPGITLVGTLQPVMTGVTLQPGTYYVVFIAANPSGAFAQGIQNTLSPTIAADVGASQDGFIYFTESPSGYVPANSFFKGGPGSGVLEYAVTTGSQGPGPTGCPVSAPTGSTVDFTDRAAFTAATSNLTNIVFAGILPPGEQFGGYSQLDVPGVTFSTPISGTFVNVTTARYYSPNVYPSDFIVDSVNQLTGQPNSNNTLCTSLTQPTFALGLDVGGLGFSGVGSGTITLSNGHVFSIQSLPTVGNTTFVGFISTQPITNLTFSTTNDSWVVEDLLLANPIVPSCTFSLSPSGQAFGSQGGLGTFFVNTGASCTWTPTFNDPWLTPFPFLIPHIAFPGGGPTFGTGPGPGRVSFNVAPNAGVARTGSISVGNQTFSVDQASGTPVCTFSINPSHAVIDDLGGNLRVVVTAPSSCVWTATSNAGWLSVATGASGQGTGAVTLKVAVNSGSARTGTVTIAGQTFTVSQGGGACGALDVTGETRALGGGYSYIPFTTYLYSGTITVTNTSAQTLHPPLFVVLVGLPNHLPYPSGDGVIGAAQTTCFTPAGDAMYLLPTGDLPPGRATAVAPLFFTQSLFGGISYQLRVLSGTPTH
jgi:hypothetical protein